MGIVTRVTNLWHESRFRQLLRDRLRKVLTHWRIIVRGTVRDNPELFFPVLLILVWRITRIAVRSGTLEIAVFVTGALVVYAFRILDGSPWLRRLGWVSPGQGFWLCSSVAGMIAGAAVFFTVRILHLSLGAPPSPHVVLLAISSGSILEELFFRGLVFSLLLELCQWLRWPQRASTVATVILVAIGFGLAHVGRTGTSLYSTVLAGMAFGVMRICSNSTAAAAVMHATYNFTLSWMSLF